MYVAGIIEVSWQVLRGILFQFYHRDIVRKKAVMAALWIYELDSSSLASFAPGIEKALCDRSPAVMGATLNFYMKLVEVSEYYFMQSFQHRKN